VRFQFLSDPNRISSRYRGEVADVSASGERWGARLSPWRSGSGQPSPKSGAIQDAKLAPQRKLVIRSPDNLGHSTLISRVPSHMIEPSSSAVTLNRSPGKSIWFVAAGLSSDGRVGMLDLVAAEEGP
jgi:hypothetical protein